MYITCTHTYVQFFQVKTFLLLSWCLQGYDLGVVMQHHSEVLEDESLQAMFG